MPTTATAEALSVPLTVPPSSPGQRALFVLWLVLAIGGVGAGGWFTYTQVAERSAERARERRDLQLQGLVSDLENENSPYTDSAQASIHLLRDSSVAFGQPTLGPAKIAIGREVTPDLRFGVHAIANDVALVDEVTRVMGGTATIFVRAGDRYIRAATNIKTDAGVRAVGTELDPKGHEIAAVRQGKTFSGVVEIFGKSSFAIYEPIRGASGETLGIWCVGYPLISGKH